MAVAARKAGRAGTGTANKTTSSKGSNRGAAPNTPQFDKNQDLSAYNDMLLIRRFEEKSGQMYGMGLIGGFCHLTSARRLSSSACSWRRKRATK